MDIFWILDIFYISFVHRFHYHDVHHILSISGHFLYCISIFIIHDFFYPLFLFLDFKTWSVFIKRSVYLFHRILPCKRISVASGIYDICKASRISTIVYHLLFITYYLLLTTYDLKITFYLSFVNVSVSKYLFPVQKPFRKYFYIIASKI